MDPEITPDEQLARYLLSRSQFSRQKRTVKSGAFMPGPSGELSVFRIRGLAVEQVWSVGLTRSLRGRS